MADLGENLVAAYQRHVRGCELLMSNVHLAGIQGELDVVAIKHGAPQTVYLCEVTTHIRGMNNPARRPAATRVREKVLRAADFAAATFPLAQRRFEIWSPRVRPGLVEQLGAVASDLSADGIDLDFVINEGYTARLQALVDVARATTAQTADDAFRLLQILTRVKGQLVL